MRLDTETRLEKVRRSYKLNVRSSLRSWSIGIVFAGIFLGILFLGRPMLTILENRVAQSGWWNALAPSQRYLLMGTASETFGVFFFVQRLKRVSPIRTLMNLRSFFAEIGMMIVGGFFLLKAGGLL